MVPTEDPAQPEKGQPSKPTQPSRRRYDPPRLVQYGSVGKLTQSGGITTKDTGSMKRVCL
jgi:hypothetical protein